MRNILMAIALLGVAQITHAGDFRPYAGAGAGLSSIDIEITGAGTGTGSSVGGFGVVGFDYGEFFGGELRVGATGNGSFTVGLVNYDVSADWFVSYLAKIQFNLSEQFKIYTLIGATTSKVTTTIKTPGWFWVATGTTKLSQTKTDASTSIGFDYQMDDQLGIGAEAMVYGSGFTMFTANLKYYF